METMEGNAADDAKNALVLVTGDQSMPRTLTLNRPTCRKVIELLSLYRLVDILYALHGQKISAGINPRYSRLPLGSMERVSYKRHSYQFIERVQDWPMNNWIDTLKKARASMKELQAMSIDSDPQQPLHIWLFGDLYCISQQHDGIKILFNVQMAAIGLFFILQGSRSSSDCVCTSKMV